MVDEGGGNRGERLKGEARGGLVGEVMAESDRGEVGDWRSPPTGEGESLRGARREEGGSCWE